MRSCQQLQSLSLLAPYTTTGRSSEAKSDVTARRSVHGIRTKADIFCSPSAAGFEETRKIQNYTKGPWSPCAFEDLDWSAIETRELKSREVFPESLNQVL